ncbi:MAG: hypothetical protein OM95_14180 [Bdellovibrio sp. ArHS]|nr:MAG: hypothetical protein OM95_14180 [Bdellovibrio sp. ArHS]
MEKRLLFGGIIGILLILTIGGTTRLTRSGLSIVEWNVVMGTLPPLHETQWQLEFAKYQLTPEFQIINKHFTLKDYKKIYFWEWFHRLLARVIFLYFAGFGLIYLLKRRSLKIISLAALVLVQGIVGWFMVKSGLRDLPRVQPLMLSIHFFLALATVSVALFYLLEKRRRKCSEILSRHRLEMGLFVLLALQVFLGCLVSGFRVGFLENTFPHMSGGFLPQVSWDFELSWGAFYHNPIYIQFIHRWVAFAVMLYFWFLFFYKKTVRHPEWSTFNILLHSQILLGVLTLILKVPVFLGILHQLTAACLLLSCLYALWVLPEEP